MEFAWANAQTFLERRLKEVMEGTVLKWIWGIRSSRFNKVE